MSANANQEILDRLSSLERANENLKKDLENNVLQLRNESVIFQRDIQKDTLQRHIDNSQLREMMQSRLVDLERKTEEIELLKTRNDQLERENQQITDRLVAMEEVVTGMGSNLAQVAEARDNIHDRLTQLEDQTHVKESNDRVNAVQSAVNSLRQDMTTLSETVDTWKLRQKSTKGAFDDRLQILKAESEELHQSLSTSLDTTQRQVEGRLQRLEAGSLEIHQTVANSLETTQRQVDDSIKNSEEKVEHRLTSVMADVDDSIKNSEEKLEHRLTSVMANVDDSIKNSEEKVEHRLTSVMANTTLLGKEVVEINNMNNDVRQSVSAARLEPTGGFVDGEWVKVDKCVWLKGSPGLMDEATGCLVPKRKGRYVVGLRMAQKGDGEIMVKLKWDGEDVGYTMVRTARNYDVQSGLVVLEMEEGGKYWLEAWRWEGKAEIAGCHVYCWFLSPC